jgi:alpha-L-arabinofuranosidase
VYENRTHEEVPFLESIATWNRQTEEATIFAVNRSMKEQILLDGKIAGWDRVGLVEHIVLVHKDPKATNTKENPGAVVPGRIDTTTRLDGDSLQATLPPLSWNVIRLRVRGAAQGIYK